MKKKEALNPLEEKKTAKILGLRLSACLEILLFFLLMAAIAWFAQVPVSYPAFSPHPFWIIVVLIAAQYGTAEALLAAAIASIFVLAGPHPVREITQDKFQYQFLLAKQPLLWFVSAVILGEIRNRHIRETNRLKDFARLAKQKEKTISEAYLSLKDIKEKLETKYATQMQTALSAYNSFKNLERADRQSIINGALELARVFLAPEKMSIFLLEKEELKLVAFSGWTSEDPFAKTFRSASSLFREIVQRKRIVCLINIQDRQILENQGVLAVPIISLEKEALYGMIKIEQIPFLRLRKASIETCRVIGEWIGSAYANSLQAEKALEGQFIEQESGLLTLNFFYYQAEFLKKLCQRLGVSLTLLHLSLEGLEKFSEKMRLEEIKIFRDTIKETLRSVDLAFDYGRTKNEFGIILVKTNLEQSEIVKKKIVSALQKKISKDINIICSASALYEA